MEKGRLQWGPKSSSVEAMSLLSWTVAQPQREAPAHLAQLLASPAQVERSCDWFILFSSNSLYSLSDLSLVSLQSLVVFSWWEERVAVQESWSWNIRENGDQWRATLSGP